MAEIRADFERAQLPDNKGELALRLLPTQDQADKLTKIKGELVTLESIYAELGQTPDSIRTFVSEHNVVAAKSYVERFKQSTEEDMVGYYLGKISDHLQAANLEKNGPDAFAAVGISRDELAEYVKGVYTRFCGNDPNAGHYQAKAEQGAQKFASFFPQ